MRLRLFAAVLPLFVAAVAHADAVSTYAIENQAGTAVLGSITIDATTGSIQSIDLPVSLSSSSVTFDGKPTAQAFSPYTNEYIATLADAGDTLQFDLPVNTLLNYAPTDRARCKTQAVDCDYLANVYVGAVNGADLKSTFEGNLAASTPTSVTPEPGTIALLGTGLLGMCGVVRRRLS